MAALRKKQSTVKNKTSANKGSKAVTKTTTTSKTVTKARSSKKTATASKRNSKKNKIKTKTANSVDGVLADFNKQRTEQEAKLVSVRKKIVQLEEKTKAFQTEIVALKSAEATTVDTIGSLDVKRDKAVRELLDKLGVKLTEDPQTSKSAKSKKKKTTQAKKKKATKTSKSKKKKTSAAKQADSESTQQKPEITALPTPLFDTVINDSANSEPQVGSNQVGSNDSPNAASPAEFTDSSSDERIDDVE